MDIKKAQFDQLTGHITAFRGNADYELEAKYKGGITLESFTRFIQYCESTRMPATHPPQTLDISFASHRFSLIGMDAVQRYCLSNVVDDTVAVMRKQKVKNMSSQRYESVDLQDIGFHIDLRKETIVSDTAPLLKMINASANQAKSYRLKRRFSYQTKHHRYDCTIVKSSLHTSKSFADAKFEMSYEIEVELLHRDMSGEADSTIAVRFLEAIVPVHDVLTQKTDTPSQQQPPQQHQLPLVSNQTKTWERVISEYVHLCTRSPVDLDRARQNPKTHFYGPQPVTLERKNLIAELGVVSILKDYTVTDKADGERSQIFVDKVGEFYLINNRLDVRRIGINTNEHSPLTLLDGEYITSDKIGSAISVFAIFDMYFHKGDDLRSLPLMKDVDPKSSRLGRMKEFHGSISSKIRTSKLDIRVKEFYADDIFVSSKKIYEDNTISNKNGYKIDGLIYTPKDLCVGCDFKGDKPGVMNATWTKVFKWKPPKDNTIDFLVEFKKDAAGNPYKNWKDDNTSSQVMTLYVGYNRLKHEKITAREYLEGRVVRPLHVPYVKHKFIPPDVAETSDLCEYSGGLVCQNGETIKDQTIVEFSHDVTTESWVPLKVRHDKTADLLIRLQSTKGKEITGCNDYMTAINVWRSIQAPVTERHITGQDVLRSDEVIFDDDDKYYSNDTVRDKMATKPMKDFHNEIKRSLLMDLPVKDPSLFDLACGKAGDLPKWIAKGVTKVFGVDVARDNIEAAQNGAYSRTYNELYERKRLPVKEKSNKVKNYVYLTMDGSQVLDDTYVRNMKDGDDKYVAQVLWGLVKDDKGLKEFNSFVTSKFDIVSCQFAVHYFFKSDAILNNFVKNVDNFLKPGGYFIGTCLDGGAVKSYMKGRDVASETINERTLWSITKAYKNRTMQVKSGDKIVVFMESIGRKMEEYLVDFELLKKKLARYNIVQEKITPFKELYTSYEKEAKRQKLSDKEKNYSFLNSTFRFRKADIADGMDAVDSDDAPRILGHITYSGQHSCYIDSMIMALLHHHPNSWLRERLLKSPPVDDPRLTKYALDIRRDLQVICDGIHHESSTPSITCADLRRSLMTFDKKYCEIRPSADCNDREWTSSQQDSLEVLILLSRAFDLTGAVSVKSSRKKQKSEGKWGRSETLEDVINDFDSQFIVVNDILDEVVQLSDHCPKDVETSNNVMTTSTTKQASAMYYQILRGYEKGGVNFKSQKVVLPAESIRFSSQNTLFCVSLIIHNGESLDQGHYTCVIRYYKDKQWYLYDDLRKGFEVIGKWQDVLDNDVIVRNVVGCVYV